MAALARGDIRALMACDDHDLAIARRCVMFILPEDEDLGADTLAMDAALEADVQLGLETERAFLAGLGR